MTLSTMTLSIMTLSIITFDDYAEYRNSFHYDNSCYAENRYADCCSSVHYDKSCYAEYHNAECSDFIGSSIYKVTEPEETFFFKNILTRTRQRATKLLLHAIPFVPIGSVHETAFLVALLLDTDPIPLPMAPTTGPATVRPGGKVIKLFSLSCFNQSNNIFMLLWD